MAPDGDEVDDVTLAVIARAVRPPRLDTDKSPESVRRRLTRVVPHRPSVLPVGNFLARPREMGYIHLSRQAPRGPAARCGLVERPLQTHQPSAVAGKELGHPLGPFGPGFWREGAEELWIINQCTREKYVCYM